MKGEPLFEIETDKATMEVESLGSGILKKILIHAGNVVKVTEEVAILADDRADAAESAAGSPTNSDVELAGTLIAESGAQTAARRQHILPTLPKALLRSGGTFLPWRARSQPKRAFVQKH